MLSTCAIEEGPSPAPIRAQAAEIQGTEAFHQAAAIRAANPARISSAPHRAVFRNPNRTMSLAATVAETAHRKTRGVTTAPAAPAVPPRAPWTNSGTNVSTPQVG